MRRRRSWQQKWKGTRKKWILGSTTLGRADFNIWQVEFTNLCYSYWRETSYSFRDLYLLRHAAVFLQHGNKFAGACHSSSSVIKIGMNCFKRLTDNYSQHSIRRTTSLEPPLSLKNNKKNAKKQAPKHTNKTKQHSSPLFPPLFCFFDYLEPCNQTKLSFGTLGAVSLSSLSGCIAKQSILLLHWLGGSATTRGLQCFALAVWSFDDKSFYQKLTVFRVMNMQWLSLVLKHRSTGWHPPPLLAAAESSNELSCSFTCAAFAATAPRSEGSCPVWERYWRQKLIATNCSWFCATGLRLCLNCQNRKPLASPGDRIIASERTRVSIRVAVHELPGVAQVCVYGLVTTPVCTNTCVRIGDGPQKPGTLLIYLLFFQSEQTGIMESSPNEQDSNTLLFDQPFNTLPFPFGTLPNIFQLTHLQSLWISYW